MHKVCKILETVVFIGYYGGRGFCYYLVNVLIIHGRFVKNGCKFSMLMNSKQDLWLRLDDILHSNKNVNWCQLSHQTSIRVEPSVQVIMIFLTLIGSQTSRTVVPPFSF